MLSYKNAHSVSGVTKNIDRVDIDDALLNATQNQVRNQILIHDSFEEIP